MLKRFRFNKNHRICLKNQVFSTFFSFFYARDGFSKRWVVFQTRTKHLSSQNTLTNSTERPHKLSVRWAGMPRMSKLAPGQCCKTVKHCLHTGRGEEGGQFQLQLQQRFQQQLQRRNVWRVMTDWGRDFCVFTPHTTTQSARVKRGVPFLSYSIEWVWDRLQLYRFL